MGCQVDRKCKAYSRYQLERIGQVMANGHSEFIINILVYFIITKKNVLKEP